MERPLQVHQHRRAAAADLGEDAQALVPARFEHRQRLLRHLAREIGHRDPVLAAEAEQPLPLERTDELEHTAAGLGHAVGNRFEFRIASEGARNHLALLRAMSQQPVGGHAEGAGAHALAHQPRHLRQFVVRGLDILGATFTHHVGAERAVRDLGDHVHDPWLAVDRVEVLGEGLPLPLHAGRHRDRRNVLDRIHQVEQPVPVLRFDWREADAAVAHDDRRHAVPARRREVRVPGHLGVEVGVDVDPARDDQLALGIDLPARLSDAVADGGDRGAVDGDVTVELGGAGAVDDAAVTDCDVVHGQSFRLREQR